MKSQHTNVSCNTSLKRLARLISGIGLLGLGITGASLVQAGPLLKPTGSIVCSTQVAKTASGMMTTNYKQLVKATHDFGAAGQFYQNTKLTVLNSSNTGLTVANTNGNVSQAEQLIAGQTYTFSFIDPANTLLSNSITAVAPNCPMTVGVGVGVGVKKTETMKKE
jgi:hypothetical protein